MEVERKAIGAAHGISLEAREFGSMHFAGEAFYYAADCQTLRYTVWVFGDAWDHPSKDLICKIVNKI